MPSGKDRFGRDAEFQDLITYEPLKESGGGIWKPRLVKKGDLVYIDIREYVENERYEGFTKRGISLFYDDLIKLTEMLPRFIADLDETLTPKDYKTKRGQVDWTLIESAAMEIIAGCKNMSEVSIKQAMKAMLTEFKRNER